MDTKPASVADCSRKELTHSVSYKKGPMGATAICPVCRKFHVSLRKPYTWGDVGKAKAAVVDHLIAAHCPVSA